MNWLYYFFSFGLVMLLIFFTFVLAVIFYRSELVKTLFLWSTVGGLLFSVFWLLFGIALAVTMAIGD